MTSPSSEHLQAYVDRLQTFSEQKNLVVNAEKSFFKAVRGNLRKEFSFVISLNGERLQQVKEFKCYGFTFNDKFNLSLSAIKVLRAVNKNYYGLTQRLTNFKPGYPMKIAEILF